MGVVCGKAKYRRAGYQLMPLTGVTTRLARPIYLGLYLTAARAISYVAIPTTFPGHLQRVNLHSASEILWPIRIGGC